MKQPKKWRETVDPFTLPLKRFMLKEVLGYPHAGNDVFFVKGVYENRELTAFIKCERQKGADIENEVCIIKQLNFSHTPLILEVCLTEPKFLVTKEILGERLSFLLAESEKENIFDYLPAYGATLADFHSLKIQCKPVAERRFFTPPPLEYMEKHGLLQAHKFLNSNCPKGSGCFIHGDFHYANVLWKDKRIVGVLDYELSGKGVREFDLAWAVFLRPGQKFLKTKKERETFLIGYSQKQNFNRHAYDFYLIQIACHFFSMGDKKYQENVSKIINDTIFPYL